MKTWTVSSCYPQAHHTDLSTPSAASPAFQGSGTGKAVSQAAGFCLSCLAAATGDCLCLEPAL